MQIKIKLNQLLRERKISNRQFAALTGISRNTINDYCNDKIDVNSIQMPLRNLAKICSTLNCTILDIIELIPEESNNEYN